MAKSKNFWMPQQVINASCGFNFSHFLNVVAVVPTAIGSNLTPGARTFTAAGGTAVTGGGPGGATTATWTMQAYGGAGAAQVSGVPIITSPGAYTATPTSSANAATVDSGSSNATWALTVGFLELLYTASTDGGRVVSLEATSTEPTTARVVSIYRQNAVGQPFDLILSASIPSLSGTTGTSTSPPVDMLQVALAPGLIEDSVGNRIIALHPGAKLFAFVPSVSASAAMRVNATIEDWAAS